jgi:hypothetical protein
MELEINALPKEVLDKANIVGNIFNILDGAEELISNLDPDEKNKDLSTLYRYIHSHNVSHSCYSVHQNWRDEFNPD